MPFLFPLAQVLIFLPLLQIISLLLSLAVLLLAVLLEAFVLRSLIAYFKTFLLVYLLQLFLSQTIQICLLLLQGLRAVTFLLIPLEVFLLLVYLLKVAFLLRLYPLMATFPRLMV